MTYSQNWQLHVLGRGVLGMLVLGALALQPAAAQSAAQAEVFFGYSLLNAEPDRDLDPFAMHGGHLEIFFPTWGGWGPVLDVSGHSRTVDAPPSAYGASEIKISQFAAMAGIRREGLRWGRVRTAARALIGLSFGTVDTDLSRSLWVEETAFAGALGGSLMLDVSDRVTIRLLQTNFFLTTFGDDTQLSQRVSTGLVVMLGGT